MSTTPKRRGIAGALVLILGLLALTLPAFADPGDRLDRIERRQERVRQRLEAATARKGELLDKISVVDQARAEVESDVSRLDGKLSELGSRIAVVEDRLRVTQQELAFLHEDLRRIGTRLGHRTDLYTERAVEAYKAGPTAYLDGLLNSESLGELVSNYTYYESVLDADSALIDVIETLQTETETKQREVEKKEAQIVADKAALEADRAEVAAVRAERADSLAALDAVLDEKKELLSAVEDRRSRYVAVQDQLESESSEIQALLSGGPSAGPAPAGNGQLLWPASGSLTSGYGWRTHPIFGDRRLHTGIDIGAPYGSSVWAADSGTVAFAGVMSGYGNVIVIEHGGGLATTYNHLSAFSVSAGQQVSRGVPVGAVGCTGYCTGPHLHFEVRINGSPVDPMPYF